MQSSIPYNGYTGDNRVQLLDTGKKSNYQDNGVLSMQSSYECDNGILMSALSDPAAVGVVFIRLANPVGTRLVEWQATKMGTPPVVPAPMDSYVAGDVILESNITVSKPTPDANSGGLNWCLAGSYVYGQASVRTQNSHYETGISSIGDSFIFAQMAQNTQRPGGSGGPGLGILAAQGYQGEYPQSLYVTAGVPNDANVPVVNFASPSYVYYSPIFSNQFFSQALVM